MTTEEARDLAQRRGMHFFEGSALTNSNVDAAFAHLIRLVRGVRKGSGGGGGEGSALMAAKKAATERGRGRGICTLL